MTTQGGERRMLSAAVGDLLVVAGGRGEPPVRDGRIVEVRGVPDGPPYVVRWSDTGTTSLYYPGPSTRISPATDRL